MEPGGQESGSKSRGEAKRSNDLASTPRVPPELMRTTETLKLGLILASTFLLLVAYQYWVVPEAYVDRQGLAAVLKETTIVAFRQLIILMGPVALVLVAGLALDRMAPLMPGSTEY
jgi:hypothetical protein